MVITEIFRSIQGESTYAGLPCIFVRLTGCNLRCRWCDTAYAFYGGGRMSVEEVAEKVRALALAPVPALFQIAAGMHGAAKNSRPVANSSGLAADHTSAEHQEAGSSPVSTREMRESSAPAITLVEITGGEPLLQSDVYPLVDRLLDDGFTVLVETSGERLLGQLPPEVVKIVDVKCPDSGEGDSFKLANLDLLGAKDEIKFVIASRRDYEFAREFTATHRLAERVHQVLFSPVAADPEGTWPGMSARDLAEWILGDGLPVRLGLQLHKFIWDPATHGV